MMSSNRRSHTPGSGSGRRTLSLRPSSDIASRKLPDLPAEAYRSRLSRLWASFKDKLSINSSRNRLRRSQSVIQPGDRRGCHKTSLPYSIYYQLLDNHETMVLPGLRQFPPPIEEDDDLPLVHNRLSLSAIPVPVSRNVDYADIAIYNGDPGRPSPPEDEPPPNVYQDIDELPKLSTDATLRTNPGRKQREGPKMAALASSINTLHHQGWYWGPLNREETENKLRPLATGSFLVRDSNDEHHLYTLSFKRGDMILHTRIEFVNGLFTFFLSQEKARENGKASVEELIKASMANGVEGEFGDTRRIRGRPFHDPIRIRLTHPVSRYNEVKSLQTLCKFVLRANMNRENVSALPLPVHVKSWVHEQNYF